MLTENQSDDYHINFSTHIPNSLEARFAKTLVIIYAEAYSGISIKELETIMQNAKKNELVFFKYGDMHRIVVGSDNYSLVKSIAENLSNTDINLDTFFTIIIEQQMFYWAKYSSFILAR